VIAISDTSLHGAAALILRRAAVEPREVILVSPEQQNTRVLAAAVHLLLVVRSKDGDIPSRDAIVRVTGRSAQRGNQRLAAQYLDLLHVAGRRGIGGIGQVRQIVVGLPRQRH
jgi:hypothetical protein